MLGNQQPNQGVRNPFSGCWGGTPAATQIIILITIIGSLLGSILPITISYLAMCPYIIIGSNGVFVYTLFTSYLIDINILSGLFSALSIYQTSSTLETRHGTLYAWLLYITMPIITNVVSLAISSAIGLTTYPRALYICNYGTWPSFFGLLAIDAYTDINPTRNCCGIVNLPTKYYPIILCLLFTLIGGLNPSYFIALGLGYLFAYMNVPSNRLIQYTESNILFKPLTLMSSYIPSSSSNTIQPFNPIAAWSGQQQSTIQQQRFYGSGQPVGTAATNNNNNQSHIVTIGSNSTTTSQQQQSKKPGDVFKSSTGHKLGSSSHNVASHGSHVSAGVNRLEQLAKQDKSQYDTVQSNNTASNAPPTYQQATSHTSLLSNNDQLHNNVYDDIDHLTGPQTTSYQPLSNDEQS